MDLRAFKRTLRADAVTWIVAIVLAAGGGFIATSQAARFAGWTRALWMRIEFGPAPVSEETAHLELKQDGESLPYFWEDEGEWIFLGLAPQNEGDVVTLTSIATEAGPVPFDELRLPSFWTVGGEPRVVEIPRAGRVGLPNMFEGVTLTFATSAEGGGVVVAGLGQVQRVDLGGTGDAAVTVRLERSDTRRAWALLPPERTRAITLAFAGAALLGVDIFDAPMQAWRASDLLPAHADGDCMLVGHGEAPSLRAVSGEMCNFDLPGLVPLNRIPLLPATSVWLVSSFGVLILLVLLRRLSYRLFAQYGDLHAEETRFGRWLRRVTGTWTVGRVAAAAWVVALVIHLSVAIALPTRSTPDSVGYYTMGNAILKQRSLDGVDTYRTPGYPLFIASTIWLFGHQTEAIVLFQHLALALLAPAVAWYLHGRTQPVFALLGGTLAGISPLTNLMGNHIWSEPLFAVSVSLALLVFIAASDRPWGALLAGVLTGAATMIRPNGSLLLVLLLAWIVLRMASSVRVEGVPRRLLASGALVVFGYGLITLPWYSSYHARTGMWGLSRSTDFTLWNNAFIQGVSQGTLAIYRPFRNFGDYPASGNWGFRDPYSLAEDLTRASMKAGEESIFYHAAVLDGIRDDPARYVKLVVEAARFNILGQPLGEGSPFAAFGELFAFLPETEARHFPNDAPPETTIGEGKGYLLMLSHRWLPPYSRLRAFLLAAGWVFIRLWGPLNVLAWLALIPVMFVAPLRRSGILWLYAGTAVLTPTVAGMPIDRYVMVAEPVLYVCGVLGVYALACCRLSPRRWNGREESGVALSASEMRGT